MLSCHSDKKEEKPLTCGHHSGMSCQESHLDDKIRISDLEMTLDSQASTIEAWTKTAKELRAKVGAYRTIAANMFANHEWSSGSFEEALVHIDRKAEKLLLADGST